MGETELGRFLRARRAGLTPADVGLPAGTGRRRTPGLRREELAALAGVSIDYYTRLERGREARPSAAVLDGLAAALGLDDEEREYLRELADREVRREPRPRRTSHAVKSSVELILESLRPNPAYLVSRTSDLLAANPSGLALLHGLSDWPVRRRNTIRYTFLHPAARDLLVDWPAKAEGCVAHLRAMAGADTDDPDLAALIGELVVKSPDFDRLWHRYDVRRNRDGVKRYRHPLVGPMTLNYEVLAVSASPGQQLVVLPAAAGTPEHDAITLLDQLAAEAAEVGLTVR